MTEESDKQGRGYTMSDKALEQRRQAAQKSTGPVTEAGKARSSRNAWRHGEFSRANQVALSNGMTAGTFGRPCRTTCPKHPENDPEHPCSLVLDGLTEAGGDCLDKSVYVDAFAAIIDGVQNGEYEQVDALAANQLAQAIEMLHHMRESVADRGVVIDQPLFDKEGNKIGAKTIANPVLPYYVKLLGELNINLPELMATPRTRQKLGDDAERDDAMQGLFEALGRAATGRPVRRPETTDGEFTEVDDE